MIACVGINGEIGKDNRMPWSLKGDLKYFRKVTEGSTVVMGRKTYESIGKPLPNRKNVVVTHSSIDDENVISLDDIDSVSKLEGDIFIIGGSSLYSHFLPYAEELYLTEVNADFEADTFFPKFNKDDYEKKTVGQMTEDGLEYAFQIYKRR